MDYHLLRNYIYVRNEKLPKRRVSQLKIVYTLSNSRHVE